MRSSKILLALAAAGVLLTVGCAGPERKLGRGITNIGEIMRMGEVRREMEQTALWEGGDRAYTRGFLTGMNKTVARVAVGAFEVLTFPFPSYEAYLKPEDPVYPDNYKPGLLSDSTFETDTNLGFSGGDVLPWFPGSRFRIFDR